MHPNALKGNDRIGLIKLFLTFFTKALPTDRRTDTLLYDTTKTKTEKYSVCDSASASASPPPWLQIPWGFNLGDDSKDRRRANRFPILYALFVDLDLNPRRSRSAEEKKGLLMDLFILKDKRGNGFEKQTVED